MLDVLADMEVTNLWADLGSKEMSDEDASVHADSKALVCLLVLGGHLVAKYPLLHLFQHWCSTVWGRFPMDHSR